ncbi:Phasin protein [Bradyrhizobium sp. CB1650]|uniref:Phasin protein n=1 Tax=Bradyrhizobium sp. CB1650 TaxID=3039153 RepID=UPI002434F4A8|nr:Phasin protein [Bradyrhizobium sp. CB1650]WGD55186.1 Phasin protein [Bradyrhizobium sp. CB1650]
MSRRKLTKASKRAPKMARVQRNKQDVVRSPKDNSPHAVAAVSIEPPLQDPKHEAPVPAGALTDLSQKKDSEPMQWLALTTANMPAYPSRLIEMAQDNLQFACDFGLKLATIRSPIDFFGVMSEFVLRGIDMFGKHSKDMAGYPFWRTEASRKLAGRPA